MYAVTFVRKDDMERETYRYKERYDAELHFATHICNRINDFKWISIASQPTSSDSLVLVEQIAVFDRDGVSTLFFTFIINEYNYHTTFKNGIRISSVSVEICFSILFRNTILCIRGSVLNGTFIHLNRNSIPGRIVICPICHYSRRAIAAFRISTTD